MTSPLNVLVERFREIDIHAARKRLVGVYLLVQDDEIVYVGQSCDLETRIESHVNEGIKTFNRALWLIVDTAEIDAYEGALIRALRPKYNGQAPAHRGGDLRILALLGLPTDRVEPRERTPRAPAASDIARRVFAWRKWGGLTQRDLGAKIEVTAAAIAQWEIGAAEPKHSRVEMIAAVLGISMSEFWGDIPGDPGVPVSAESIVEVIDAATPSAFGTAVNRLRTQRGLSMAALGDALGVSSATVCGWENGTHGAPLKRIAAIAGFFGCEVRDLLEAA